MYKPLEAFIGLRYVRAKRRNHFISFISLISMLGIALGVTTLITVISVMNGFDKEMRERILSLVPHISVYSHLPIERWQETAAIIAEHPEVREVSAFTQFDSLLMRAGKIETAAGIGLDVNDEAGAAAEADTGAKYIRTDVTSEEGVSASLAQAADLNGGLNAAINCGPPNLTLQRNSFSPPPVV